MEILILELIWWGILFLFFWALRDARGRLQEDVEALALINDVQADGRRKPGFQRPQKVRELIGSYQGEPIYHYAELDGRTYQFDRVCPLEAAATIDRDELYLAPGLVYQECAR